MEKPRELWPQRWAWMPIPLLVVAMLVLSAMDLRASYESSSLLMGLNFIFSVLASLSITYLIGRSFLVRGDPGLLMLGCGVCSGGAAGFVGIAAGLLNAPANLTSIFHNNSQYLRLAVGSVPPDGRGYLAPVEASHSRDESMVDGGYAVVLGVVGLVTCRRGGLDAAFLFRARAER